MTPSRALSYCLATLAFTLPLSIAGANASLAATTAVLLWMLSRDNGREAAAAALGVAARNPVFLALAAGFAWAAVSGLAGMDPLASLKVLPKDLHKLWAFLAVSVALALANDVAIATPLAAGLGLHAAVGVAQTLQKWTGGEQSVRAHGFLHPVSYSEIMGLGLIAVAAWLARPPKEGIAPSRRRGAVVLLVLLAAALVAAQTRAVILALAAAYFLACWVEPLWRRWFLAGGLAVLGVFAFWEVMPTGGRNLSKLFSRDAQTSSHRSRLVLWDVALRIAGDRPLTGVGPGRYRDAFPRYHPEKLDGEDSWGSAHDLYLHQLAERGLPGLLILLAALAAFIRGAVLAERERRDARSMAAVAATAAFLIMNLTEVAWQTEQAATFFLFIWLAGTSNLPAREIL